MLLRRVAWSGVDSSEQMFLNLSPLAAHLNESLCSLRFATKASINKTPDGGRSNADAFVEQVNNTQIGTAKKQVKSTS
jgi:kinesin family protein C1